MNEQHTQGQLHVFTGYAIPELRMFDGTFVASLAAYDLDRARRLAACWNWCEGLTTKDLESKDIAGYVVEQAFITGMAPSESGMEIGLKGIGAQLLAASFAGQFAGTGATNYLEIRMSHPAIGPFSVTIQRTEGTTPVQKLKSAEAQRDELLIVLSRLLKSDPSGEIATASDELLTAAVNDESASPVVREQAAAILQARAAIAHVEGGS